MTLNYPCIIVSHERLPNGFTCVALWWGEDAFEDIQKSLNLDLFKPAEYEGSNCSLTV